jgi:8-oxo-dGTP pyrophosphatase MutT (NUDIX family)
MRLRSSSRVILLDEEDRIFLLKFEDPMIGGRPFIFRPGYPFNSVGWVTPGGGVEEGESHEQAACRELWEETGITIKDPGPCVAVCNPILDWAGEIVQAHDWYYLRRLAAPVVSLVNMNDSERAGYIDHRWWTTDELHSTDERIMPISLAQLMLRIVAGHVPTEPVELPD